jgi:GMP synthase-like glutamine amidotransferase
MSVNDELPWIGPMLHLIRDAVDADVPLLGHCLGGQLISKAMGGVVSRNAVKEIGWGDVSVADSGEAQRWFGHATPSFTSFHWHGAKPLHCRPARHACSPISMHQSGVFHSASTSECSATLK